MKFNAHIIFNVMVGEKVNGFLSSLNQNETNRIFCILCHLHNCSSDNKRKSIYKKTIIKLLVNPYV